MGRELRPMCVAVAALNGLLVVPSGQYIHVKYVTLLAFDVIFQKLGGQIRVYSSPKYHYWLI